MKRFQQQEGKSEQIYFHPTPNNLTERTVVVCLALWNTGWQQYNAGLGNASLLLHLHRASKRAGEPTFLLSLTLAETGIWHGKLKSH